MNHPQHGSVTTLNEERHPESRSQLLTPSPAYRLNGRSSAALRKASTSRLEGIPEAPTPRRLRAATAFAKRPAVMAEALRSVARVKNAAAKVSPAPVRSTAGTL